MCRPEVGSPSAEKKSSSAEKALSLSQVISRPTASSAAR